MANDEKKSELLFEIRGLIEHTHDADGACRTESHGSNCGRTQQVREALERGEMPPPAGSYEATRCGPPRVNSDAYRAGWAMIFGQKQTVGSA